MNNEFKEKLLNALPHGSGINGKWELTEHANSVVCSNFWHCINENGYYDGYIDFDIVFRNNVDLLDFEIHAKNWKFNRYKIEKYWKDLQVKEYIEDTVYYALQEFQEF